jgi:hypothetical protein
MSKGNVAMKWRREWKPSRVNSWTKPVGPDLTLQCICSVIFDFHVSGGTCSDRLEDRRRWKPTGVQGTISHTFVPPTSTAHVLTVLCDVTQECLSWRARQGSLRSRSFLRLIQHDCVVLVTVNTRWQENALVSNCFNFSSFVLAEMLSPYETRLLLYFERYKAVYFGRYVNTSAASIFREPCCSTSS